MRRFGKWNRPFQPRTSLHHMTTRPGTWLIFLTLLVSVPGCQTPGPERASEPTQSPLLAPDPTPSSGATAGPAAVGRSHQPLASKTEARSQNEATALGEAVESSSADSVPPVYLPGTDRFLAASKPAPFTETEPGKITLNFENTNLREVVKVIVGDLLGRNFAIDPRVQGSVTLQTGRPLHREALLPTLEMLLRMNDATLVNDRGLYAIVPSKNALQVSKTPQLGDVTTPLPTGYTVYVVPLEHVGAREMQEILKPLATAENLVRVDTERNLLVLAGTGQEIARLLETVRLFDVDWLAGKSFGLFSPEFADVKTLAEELTTLFGDDKEGPLAGLVRLVPVERINALLVITARKQYLKQVALWIKRLDREPRGTGQRLFVYPVQNGRAIDLANVLSQVFGTQPAEPTIPPAQLAPGLRPVQLTGRTASAMAASQASPQPFNSPSANAPWAGNPGSATRTGVPPATGVAASDLGVTPPTAAAGNDQQDARRGTRALLGSRTAASEPRSVAAPDLAVPDPQPMRIIPDEINNALVILATEPQYRQIRSALRQLDVVPLQVLIEATLADVFLTDELLYGVEWFFTNNVGNSTAVTRLGNSPIQFPAGFTGFTFGIVNAADAVKALLRALAAERKLDILASPSLMVLNNQAANINVGDEVPVVTQQQQSTLETANIINNVERQRTGVLLTVMPRVNKGGLIIMDIVQNVSNVDPGTVDSPFGPTIQNREITSTVAVQSGETLVLGGLIRERNRVEKSGVPLFQDLPLVGPLFGTRGRGNERTELIVLITPRAVQDAQESRMITEEIRSKMQGIRPWPLDQSPPPAPPEDKATRPETPTPPPPSRQ